MYVGFAGRAGSSCSESDSAEQVVGTLVWFHNNYKSMYCSSGLVSSPVRVIGTSASSSSLSDAKVIKSDENLTAMHQNLRMSAGAFS